MYQNDRCKVTRDFTPHGSNLPSSLASPAALALPNPYLVHNSNILSIRKQRGEIRLGLD